MPPRQKRQRNKSSPLDLETTKKQKPNCNNPDGSFIEESFENWTDSLVYTPSLGTGVDTGLESEMSSVESKFTKKELKELVSILGSQLKSDLIKEIKADLKSELKNDIVREVNSAVITENEILRNELAKVRTELEEMKQSALENFLFSDENEQYSRKMCLDVSGIPGDTGNPKEDTTKIILDHVNKVTLSDGSRLKLTRSDIDKSHRKGKFRTGLMVNRKTIVKFTNSEARQRVYDARKQLGNGIFVQENITRYRESLSYEARQLVRAHILGKTWVAGCKVYASFPTKRNAASGAVEGGYKVHIKSMQTIKSIEDGSLLASLNTADVLKTTARPT